MFISHFKRLINCILDLSKFSVIDKFGSVHSYGTIAAAGCWSNDINDDYHLCVCNEEITKDILPNSGQLALGRITELKSVSERYNARVTNKRALFLTQTFDSGKSFQEWPG